MSIHSSFFSHSFFFSSFHSLNLIFRHIHRRTLNRMQRTFILGYLLACRAVVISLIFLLRFFRPSFCFVLFLLLKRFMATVHKHHLPLCLHSLLMDARRSPSAHTFTSHGLRLMNGSWMQQQQQQRPHWAAVMTTKNHIGLGHGNVPMHAWTHTLNRTNERFASFIHFVLLVEHERIVNCDWNLCISIANVAS